MKKWLVYLFVLLALIVVGELAVYYYRSFQLSTQPDLLISKGVYTDELIFPFKKSDNQVSTYWFTPHEQNGNILGCGGECEHKDELKVCWAIETDIEPFSPLTAMEISIYSKGDTNPMVINVDPSVGEDRIFQAERPDGPCVILDEVFAYSKKINFEQLGLFTDQLEYMTLRMKNNTTSHYVGITYLQ